MSADVADSLKNWSASEGSNSPSGSTAISSNLDDNLRMLQAVVRSALASKGSDVSSASTADIGAVEGLYHDITGTTTITGLGTVSAGIWKILQFDGALTLTHNATSLILPGNANITTAAGDHLLAFSLGSGNWIVPFYLKDSGLPVVGDFPDSFFRIVGSSDATKKLAFEVDGNTTGTTRIATFPDANLTLPAVAAKGDIATGTAAGVLGVTTVGSDNTILAADSSQSTGVAWREKLTVGTPSATTSGTSIDITGIPAWAKRVTILFEDVSCDSASEYLVQIGDSGGIENSGYTSESSATTSVATAVSTATSGFVIRHTSASAALCGSLVLSLSGNANTWVASGAFRSLTTTMVVSAGKKATSATLDRIRLTSLSGTATFDGGSITVIYE